VDATIERMIETYGEAALKEMSANEFYAAYKQFSTGTSI